MMRTLLALTMFRSRLLVCGLVAACFGSLAASPAHAAWTWEKGGLLDGSTGLVWSQSQAKETGSWWTWDTSKTRAANYAVATYDDWRVPTVKQLQTAISNGTIALLIPKNAQGGPLYYGKVYLWSSESRGNRGWAVSLDINNLGEVVGGGEAKLFLKDSGFEVFFVRP